MLSVVTFDKPLFCVGSFSWSFHHDTAKEIGLHTPTHRHTPVDVNLICQISVSRCLTLSLCLFFFSLCRPYSTMSGQEANCASYGKRWKLMLNCKHWHQLKLPLTVNNYRTYTVMHEIHELFIPPGLLPSLTHTPLGLSALVSAKVPRSSLLSSVQLLCFQRPS